MNDVLFFGKFDNICDWVIKLCREILFFLGLEGFICFGNEVFVFISKNRVVLGGVSEVF